MQFSFSDQIMLHVNAPTSYSYFNTHFNLLIGTLCLICLLDTGKLDIYKLVPVCKKLNKEPIDFGVDSSLTG